MANLRDLTRTVCITLIIFKGTKGFDTQLVAKGTQKVCHRSGDGQGRGAKL